MYGYGVLVLAAGLLADHAIACGGGLHGTILGRRALDNTRILGRSSLGPIDYSYTESLGNGPSKWSTLDPSYALCGNGTKQTPIDVDTTKAVNGSNFKLSIAKQASAKIEIYDHTIQVTTTGTFVNAGKTYNILQYHFHTPSEHVICGKSYPMEVHFVGKASDGSLSVAGFMISTGAADALLTSTFSNVAKLENDGDVSTTGALDFGPIAASLSNNKVFVYNGSLTTPPCAEGVAWVLSMTPLTMDSATYAAVKKVIGPNSRPLQKNVMSL